MTDAASNKTDISSSGYSSGDRYVRRFVGARVSGPIRLHVKATITAKKPMTIVAGAGLGL